MDQLKFEKSNFITKGSQKFRDNYIIGQQMGTGMSITLTIIYFKGAFGEVRMCQHRKLRAIRAVKILKKSALLEDEIKKFVHEIEILKTLVSLSKLDNRII
jgi:serine/threonine protein kinase